jgi:hypothetical protein
MNPSKSFDVKKEERNSIPRGLGPAAASQLSESTNPQPFDKSTAR